MGAAGWVQEEAASGRIEAAEALVGVLGERGVRAVALVMVDNAGISRVKSVPLGRYVDAVRSGVGLSRVFSMATVDDTFPMSPAIDGPAGDLRLFPDPAATRSLPAMPGWAWAPVDQLTQAGDEWPACARSFARRLSCELGDRGFRLEASFEHEFFVGTKGWNAPLGVMPDNPDPIPAHVGPAYGAIALTDLSEFGLALMEALEAQDIDVMQFHPEYAVGQCEVSVAHVAAVAAADDAVTVRQTIRGVARRSGYDVSFAPVVDPGSVGNGMHLHMSLCETRSGSNLSFGGDGPAGMTEEAEAFFAGILDELPALAAIACPSVVSYDRLQPHRWSGASATWGVENREAALRFVPGMIGNRRRDANMELKIVDGAANPYLVIGSVIAAGLAGLEGKARLPEGTQRDPCTLNEDEARRAGVRRLPSSLAEALEELEGSEVLHSAMGGVLFDAIRLGRRAEVESFADMDPLDVVRFHRWRY